MEAVFRESDGKCKHGPARVVTKALVSGFRPRGFKIAVERKPSMHGKWKEDHHAVFDVVWAAGFDWRTVEQADNHRTQARGKPNAVGKNAHS